MRGHRASGLTHRAGSTAPPFGSRPNSLSGTPARGVAGLDRSPRYALRPAPGGANVRTKPNATPDRRIGLAVRYIPTYVRQVKLDDSAILVRGHDRHGNFEHEPQPCADLDAAALAAHATAMQRMIGTVYSGTDVTEARR